MALYLRFGCKKARRRRLRWVSSSAPVRSLGKCTVRLWIYGKPLLHKDEKNRSF